MTTEADVELLPCPFCGKQTAHHEADWNQVDCLACGASGPADRPDLAITAWNTRASAIHTAPEADVEQVARALQKVTEWLGESHSMALARAAIAAMPKPTRKEVARIIHFMHGDGLDLESALSPDNDGHWRHWTATEPEGTRDAFAAADAILALFNPPSEGGTR